MSAQVPSAVFPIPPPVAKLQIIDSNGRFTMVGLNLFTQLWAGLQGGGGAIDQIALKLNKALAENGIFVGGADGVAHGVSMSGDAAIDDTGKVTIQPNAVTTPKINGGAVTYAKIQQVAADRLLGNATGAPATAAEVALGIGLAFVAGVLVAVTPPVAVAALPVSPPSGARAMVNDATVTTFASIVVGLGANVVPVYWDNAAWRIG